MFSPTAICPFKNASSMVSPKHATSPVDPISTCKIGSAPVRRAKENCATFIAAKLIGGIVVLFVVIYLLYVLVFRSGAPLQLVSRGPNWHYNSAALLHRKAEEAYREGKRTKADRLFKKAQGYRETGEHKQR